MLYSILLPLLQVSPVSNVPPFFHTHPSNCWPYSVLFFSQYFSFSLSISFHLCSTLIQPYTTKAVKFFSLSASVFLYHYNSTIPPNSFYQLPPMQYNFFLPLLQNSPVSIIPPLLHTLSNIYHI